MVDVGVRKTLGSNESTISHLLTIIGFGLIALGAVLPWASKDLPVKVYVLGMQSGLERIWVRRLLLLAGVGLLVEVLRLVTSNRKSALTLILGAIGLLVAVLTVATSPLTGPWVPARGVYVTLVGSLLVTMGACVTLVTMQLTGDAPQVRSVEH